MKRVNINDVQEVNGNEVKNDWIFVTTHDIGNKKFSPDPFEWWSIYQKPDGTLVRVKCWDGTRSSYQPEINCRQLEEPDIDVYGRIVPPPRQRNEDWFYGWFHGFCP